MNAVKVVEDTSPCTDGGKFLNLISDDSEDIFSTVKGTKRDMVIQGSTVKVPCRVNIITTEFRTYVIF